jgi:hypothetical protein
METVQPSGPVEPEALMIISRRSLVAGAAFVALLAGAMRAAGRRVAEISSSG